MAQLAPESSGMPRSSAFHASHAKPAVHRGSCLQREVSLPGPSVCLAVGAAPLAGGMSRDPSGLLNEW